MCWGGGFKDLLRIGGGRWVRNPHYDNGLQASIETFPSIGFGELLNKQLPVLR